jgi:hypothetical protein
MKRFLFALLTAVSLLTLTTSVGIVAGGGCAAPTQQTVTFNTLYATGHSVSAAFAAYSDLLIAGKVSTNSLPQIAAAYNEFNLAYAAALSLAQMNTNAAPPPELVSKAAALVTTIQQQK